MISLKHIQFFYEADRPVLKNLSMELARGSFTFLTGASGAGKTSLLSILSLMVRPTSGQITAFGKNPLGLPREQLPFLRRNIGLVSQDFRLLNHLTVAENVALPLKIAGDSEKEIESRVNQMLEWIGLSEYKNVRPEILSGGEKQRVAISRAIITNPQVLLADEPTGNLDPVLSERLIYLFEALGNMGTTILIATHDEQLISRFDHPRLHLESGKLVSR